MECGSSKNLEIQEMFKIIFNNRLKSGYGKEQARRMAIDAITLRFGLSEERIRKILYMRNQQRGHNNLYYTNNVELISYLRESIEEYQNSIDQYQDIIRNCNNNNVIRPIAENVDVLQEKIDRNYELIGYLEEENDYYRGDN